jgi:hypothetical protein
LKIAHINNTAGVPITLADEQRRSGHTTDVFVFNKTVYKLFGGNIINYRSPISRWKLFKKLQEYELWHYHYPYGSLKKNLEKRNSDKIYLKHYHGEDLRQIGEENDFCLVATPDLLELAPSGKWLPTPLNLDYYAKYKQQTENDIVQLIHYPAYKLQPSVPDYYSQVLTELKNQQKCRLITTLDYSYEKMTQLMANSDIIIGKIRLDMGWFGKFELEGMALGKAVIAYVSDELYSKYRPPIYRTTRETFKSDLETLLQDQSERQRLGKNGLQYVQNHDVKKVVADLEQYYSRAA